jgi:hypothetical protein
VRLRRSDLDGIPPDNVNIPVREFARGWFAAEQLLDDRAGRGVSDWYTAAVAVTCRWLARATVRPEARAWYSERSPLTHRGRRAHPEWVQEEAFEAQNMWERRNKPSWLLARPGWLEGVLDTFDWAWWSTRAGPPIDIDDLNAG